MTKFYTGNNLNNLDVVYFEIEDNKPLHCNEIAEKVDNLDLSKDLEIYSQSDHTLNRLLVRYSEKEFDLEVYFWHDYVQTQIKVEKGGRIRYPPKGFFDQFAIDRKILMEF